MISFGSPIDKTSIFDPSKLATPSEMTSVGATSGGATITLTKSSKAPNTRVNFDQGRKFNIALYGAEESPLNTPRSKCVQDDLSKCLRVLHNLEADIQASSIKDYYHLGKINSAKSRHILVKFF